MADTSVRPVSRAPSQFAELAQIVRDRGLLRRRYGYYWTKLIAAPLLLAGVLVAFVVIGDTWWQMFTAAALAVLLTQIAFLGHDAAHRQIFVSGRWNDWTSLVIADLLVGMSYGWWQHKHTRHHANPNKLGADPDIELPVIAVTAETAARSDRGALGWLRAHQGLFFFPVLLFEALSLHASSVRRLTVRAPLDRRWIEIALLVVRIGGTQTGLFASYGIVIRYINRVGLGEREVFTCPLVAQRSSIIA